jgi:hypothetical protein
VFVVEPFEFGRHLSAFCRDARGAEFCLIVSSPEDPDEPG